MINREIIYKRDMNNSYMIIPAMSEYSFDEGQLMEKSIEHLLPVEKCYVATMGQYWYDITGKQALDSYCRLHSIGKDFFQVLVLKLCQLVESLEWHLIDVNCVVLDPEMIFVNGYDEDVMFVAYPFHKGNLASEMQQLMEYLLTKLDHSDTSAIGWAYQLYEMALQDGVSITAIKNVILEDRAKKIVPLEQKPEELFAGEISLQPEVEEETFLSSQEENFLNVPVKELKRHYDQGKEWCKQQVSKWKDLLLKETTPLVVYPEDVHEEEHEVIHPTIGIRVLKEKNRELRPECSDAFPSFELNKSTYLIGKNSRAQFCVRKDTVSQFHARIDYQGEDYYIEDLNSTNGTFVNEEVLSYKSRRRLQSGDRIRFGDVEYRFC